MTIPAGALNRKVTFSRRVAVPAAYKALRGGFEAMGAVWGAYRDRRPYERNMGGFLLQGRQGTLTIRDDGWARSLTGADRVTISGEEFEILSVAAMGFNGVINLDVASAPTGDAYARQFDQKGQVVSIRRIRPNAANLTVGGIRAIITGYEPDELAAGIAQGDRKVFLSAADIAASGLPLPLQRGQDRVVDGSREMTIEEIDDSTHRIAGELLAYQVRVTG